MRRRAATFVPDDLPPLRRVLFWFARWLEYDYVNWRVAVGFYALVATLLLGGTIGLAARGEWLVALGCAAGDAFLWLVAWAMLDYGRNVKGRVVWPPRVDD